MAGENTIGAKLEKAIDEVRRLADAILQGTIGVVSHKEMDLLVGDDYEKHLRLLVEAAEMLLRQIETQCGAALMFHRCRGKILPYPAFLCSMCPPGQEKVEFNPRTKIRELEEQVFLKDRRIVKVERERDELRRQLEETEK